MTLITDKPKGLASSNDLDKIPDDILEIPPAYLVFGTSPEALPNPPAVDEIRIYVVKAVCVGVHGPLKRKDGELRYTRGLQILGAWESGKQPPTIGDTNQLGLFDQAGQPNVDGEPDDEEHVVDAEVVDDDEDQDGDLNAHDPAFSHTNTAD